MKLTRVERWILYNQALILQHLKSNESKYYKEMAEALEFGYEREYDAYCPVNDDKEALSPDECREVVDILQMFRHLKWSYNALPPEERSQYGLEPIDFPGFDGNEETKQFSYAQFFCTKDAGRFAELGRPDGFNSHAPMLSHYRAMLAIWRQYPKGESLSGAAIAHIMNAH